MLMLVAEGTSAIVGGNCSCRGRNLEKLIRPALLIVLAKGELCGYRIVQLLSEMPMFCGEKPNASGVYRALAAMAKEELVSASWDTSAAGPAKRLYQITQKGRVCLEVWLETLMKYRSSIDSLLVECKAVLGTLEDPSCCCSEE
jgi:PadR family transcriptional regulator, regulatory protein PadR